MPGKSNLLALLTMDHAHLARVEEERGNLAKAARHLARGGAQHKAAALYARAGDEKRTVEAAFKAALGKKAEIDPETTPLQAAELMASAGFHREAVPVFELAKSFHLAAKSALKSGQKAKAGQCFEKARLWTKAATCYEKAGKPTDAVRALEHEARRLRQVLAKVHQPQNAQLLRRVEAKRAELLIRLGRRDEASVVREGAPELRKSGRQLEAAGDLRAAADAYLEEEDPASALRLVRKIPGFEQPRLAEILLAAGEALKAARIFAAVGHTEKAAEAFEQAEAWAEAGESWETLRSFARAGEAFGKAGRPLDAGRCYQAAGERELAKKAFEAARAEERAAARKAAEKKAQKKAEKKAGAAEAKTRAAAARRAPAQPPDRAAASGDAAEEESLSIGQVFAGRYRILSLLGQGGMAKVYRAEDQVLGEEVAIKTLPRQQVGSADLEARLLREVQICRKLTHPNIVRVHDVGQFSDGLFITMELVEGPGLDQLLAERGALPLPYVKAVLGQITAGLAEAHGLGVVHRDLKPSNLIVAAQRVKILDFGIARRMAGAETRLTQTGHAIGTPVYMSPEQVEGKALDGRSDLYSLGVLAFKLLTGEPPFRGENLAVIALAHLQQPPPDPRTLRPGLPVEWVAVLGKLLAKAPEERYASAGALLAALSPLPTEEAAGDPTASETVGFNPPKAR